MREQFGGAFDAACLADAWTASRLVREVLAEPALGLGDLDPLPLGVVDDLVAPTRPTEKYRACGCPK